MFEQLYREIKEVTDKWSLELKLLIECLRGWSPETGSSPDEIDLADINWDSFLNLVKQHRLIAIVYKVLKQRDEKIIPDEVRNRLKTLYKQNALNSLKLCAETARAVSRFNKAGISSLVLKGVPLAQELYGDISLRHSGDIDILIHPDDLIKADNILRKSGYRPNYFDFRDLSPKQLEICFKRIHHQNYRHNTKNIILELHWSLKADIHCKFSEIEFFFESAYPLEISNTTVFIFNRPINFIYLCIHGTLHGWTRLKWLLDIVLLSRLMSNDEWETIWDQANKGGVLNLILQTCILINHLFGITFPFKNMTTQVPYRIIRKLVYLELNSISKDHQYSGNSLSKKIFLLCNPNLASKTKFVFSHFIPRPEYFADFKIPDRYFLLYYLIRPFIVLHKKLSDKIT